MPGRQKLTPPNTHPSNPIHKAAMAAQNRPKISPPNSSRTAEKTPTPAKPETENPRSDRHEINKAAVIVGVVGVVALLFMALR